MILNRGDDFRKAFSEIGSLRSIIPRSVNILALTATATKETLDIVTERLSLKNPAVIGLPPDRENIKFNVKVCASAADFSSVLADELMLKGREAPKTVVFCRTLQHCANLYTLIKRKMGKNLTDPPGKPNVLHTRLVDLFTGASTPETREIVLREFSKPETKLRLIIASTAFGLGVDCPDIVRVMNWGAPNTLEDLVQESGRGGRDGSAAEAILYPKIVGKRITKEMKEYGENQTVC